MVGVTNGSTCCVWESIRILLIRMMITTVSFARLIHHYLIIKNKTHNPRVTRMPICRVPRKAMSWKRRKVCLEHKVLKVIIW
uniref:Putative secreted protein n=1 Tax=Xenopsylla cheopis TaxID=163159 RepID=A0A6M2DZ04_XENCH